MPNPIPYHKKFDKLTEDEQKLLEINKKSIEEFVEQSVSISDTDHATRNAHAKTYAVVKGNFSTTTDFPEELQQLFNEKQWDIMVRFSNAHLKITKKDIPAYGLALKIMQQDGSTIANYPLVNFPLFPINSVSIFLKLFTSINKIFTKKWWYVFPFITQSLKIVPYFFTFSFFKSVLKLMRKRNDFILSFDYHSVGVYRLGNNMIKLKVVPKGIDPHFGKDLKVKEAIEKYLSSNDYNAEVFVQICYDLKDQPINVLNVEWQNSPFIKIGNIKIEKNALLDPHSCENEMLSFNPYESLTEFQPVGKIQKLRNEAYKISLETRNKINKLLKSK